MATRYSSFPSVTFFTILLPLSSFLLKLEKPIVANYVYFLVYMPWRQVSRFTGGKIKESTVVKLLEKL